MNPSYLVFAPVRFSPLSFLHPLALILFLISLCLPAVPAQAGTWLLTVTGSGSTSGGQKKPQTLPLPVSGTGSVSVPAIVTGNIGSTDSNGNTKSIHPSASDSLRVTGNWQPANSNDNAPPNVIFEVQTTAKAIGYIGYSNAGTIIGDVSDGFASDTPDANGQASGTHYRLETVTNGSFTSNLQSPNASVSATSGPNGHQTVTDSSGIYTLNYIGQCSGSASVGPITFSIVNGSWAGPYYFHHGFYADGKSDNRPWANNTAGDKPSITDNADSVSGFLFHNTATKADLVEGSITPVWYWTGPDLGVPPPPFQINVTASASSVDNTANPVQTYELDGIDDDMRDVGPAGATSSGSESVAVEVQSDEYAPGEGNGYWAIGPTIDMYASIDGNTGDDLTSWIGLDVSVESSLNN